MVDITEHLPLVHWVLKKHLSWAVQGRIDYDDLFQAGCLGLMRAAKKFEPERGIRFSTCAVGCVRAFVLVYIKCNHRLARVPMHLLDKKLAPPEYVTYLDTPLPNHESTRHEVTGAEDPEYEQRAARSDFDELVGRLPPRLRRDIRLRLRGYLLEENANELGCSRERARQLERDAVQALRKAARKLGLTKKLRPNLPLRLGWHTHRAD